MPVEHKEFWGKDGRHSIQRLHEILGNRLISCHFVNYDNFKTKEGVYLTWKRGQCWIATSTDGFYRMAKTESAALENLIIHLFEIDKNPLCWKCEEQKELHVCKKLDLEFEIEQFFKD